MKPPSVKTLQKYGLSEKEWLAILERQGGVCAVCKKVPATERLNVDHDHVYRWKHLKASIRASHVRGLLCYWCNRTYVGRAITQAKAEAVVEYLKAHNERIIAGLVG